MDDFCVLDLCAHFIPLCYNLICPQPLTAQHHTVEVTVTILVPLSRVPYPTVPHPLVVPNCFASVTPGHSFLFVEYRLSLCHHKITKIRRQRWVIQWERETRKIWLLPVTLCVTVYVDALDTHVILSTQYRNHYVRRMTQRLSLWSIHCECHQSSPSTYHPLCTML